MQKDWFGRIALDNWSGHTADMRIMYFGNDGFVYVAFKKPVPPGFNEISKAVFIQATKDLYAKRMQYGEGKPIIAIADKDTFGIVILSDNITEDTELLKQKAASAFIVKQAYDMAVAAYNSVSTTGVVGAYVYDALKGALHSRTTSELTKIDGGTSYHEEITNSLTGKLLASLDFTIIKKQPITQYIKFYDDDGAVKESYVVTMAVTDGRVTMEVNGGDFINV